MRTAFGFHRIWITLAALATDLSPGYVVAEGPIAGSPAATIADGQPWVMHTADGTTLQLTLHDNGTGLIEGGPVPLTPKWRPTPDGFCMTPNLLLGERCMVLERDTSGYVARRNGDITFSLAR